MSKKRVDYVELRAGRGLARGLDTAFDEACERNNVPIEAIKRLVTPASVSTWDAIAQHILADWQAEQPQAAKSVQPQPTLTEPNGGDPYRSAPTNGNAPFSAPIVYLQPEFEELKRRFPAYVDPNYKGNRFNPIECCKTVSKENREVAFEYVHMNRKASNDEVLAEIKRKGLRPALYEELLGFDEKYPDEQRKFPIVALGSEADVRGGRCVAYLWGDDLGRVLGLRWLDGGWHGDYRFLAVRK